MFNREEIETQAQKLFEKLRYATKEDGNKYTLEDCLAASPKILEINKLKKEKNAVILAHSYTTPDIVYGVGDFKGDSYYLSVAARDAKEAIIVFAGVVFMAETAKILSPQKTVIIPDPESGCGLADNFYVEDLQALKRKYPNAPVLCYINSTAQVKALSDICVTSSVVYDIVAKMKERDIIFVPDRLMAENIRIEMKRRNIDKKIISGNSACCVHERFNIDDLRKLKSKYPNAKAVSHPECKSEITGASDFVGGTGNMMKYCKESNADTFIILSEWGLVNRLEIENPHKKFISPLMSACTTMKYNTLDKILEALKNPHSSQIVDVEESVRKQALNAINRMFEYAKK
ncbi:MAG TPA: quinolinate synthase NadA [Elusimicrobiales bacterium]|nr:quinolinate synthase NadA [Elusimicrobiales bacterium]